jgi:hypothetical protein
MNRTLLQQALEALVAVASSDDFYDPLVANAITAIRKELETIPLDTPEQEPVAWMSPGKERLEFSRPDTVYGSHTIPLYREPISWPQFSVGVIDSNGDIYPDSPPAGTHLYERPAPIPPGMVYPTQQHRIAALEAENAALQAEVLKQVAGSKVVFDRDVVNRAKEAQS